MPSYTKHEQPIGYHCIGNAASDMQFTALKFYIEHLISLST